MSSQIQILRGSNANIVQNTSARVNAVKPLYNTNKNYFTIAHSNSSHTTIKPIVTPEVIGFTNDGVDSTNYITSSTTVEYSLNKISNTVRLYSKSLPINLMVNGTTTAELSVTDGLVTIPTATISTAQVSSITGEASSFNVFNSNMSISRTNSVESAEDEWEQLNITSDDRLRLSGQNEVTLSGMNATVTGANSIISGTTSVSISSPSTTIGALQVTRNGAYAMDIFNDGNLRIATGNNATISAGMDVNIEYSGTANLHSSYIIPSGGGTSSTTINATTSPTTSSILLNSAFGASNVARIQLTTGSSQSDIGITANNIYLTGSTTINGNPVVIGTKTQKYQHNIVLYNQNIGEDHFEVRFSLINEESSAYDATNSPGFINLVNAVLEIEPSNNMYIPATGHFQNHNTGSELPIGCVTGIREFNGYLYIDGISLQSGEFIITQYSISANTEISKCSDVVIPITYIG